MNSLNPQQLLHRTRNSKKQRPALTNLLRPAGSDEEIQIAAIWSDVLLIDQVGVGDNFFDLGGDSIHVVRILAQIYDRYECEISIGEFFDSPTIEELAFLVQQYKESH